MNQNIVPHASVFAAWQAEGDSSVLRVQAANPRKAWSGRLIGLSAVFGCVSGALVLISTSDVTAAGVTVLLCGVLCATVVGYMRLSLNKCEVTVALGEQEVSIDDGSTRHVIALAHVNRLLIVHDGAAARIAVDSAQGKLRYSIGCLYRHNALERFISEMPETATQCLNNSGLALEMSQKRGVYRSLYRRYCDPA